MSGARITTKLLPMLWRGVRARCPRCGSRGWFASGFTRRERCPGCGLRIERAQGMAVGATTANTIVTFGLFGLVILVGTIATYPDLAVVPMLVASLAIALLVPIAFYRSSYTTWGAIELRMHPLEPDELADATRAASGAGPAPGSGADGESREGA
jgi:uncharacterized protein (DUF983 family)